MAKEQSTKNKKTKRTERGITPGKVAYAYGISLETFKTWIGNSQSLNDRVYEEGDNLLITRKWTPRQLQKIFDEFGDPREYQDIIDS